METRKTHYYRPDIDGLRAIAILAVVFFHANLFGFSGGFVGVDIFFVISGFLITSILLRELKHGTFSFSTFWERRMRRILPALLVVTVIVSFFGYFLFLYPLDFTTLAKSLVAQGIFLSNLFFMRQDTYFDPTVENFPLLHTWSLAVEEQFYILFPIFLFSAYALFRKHIPTVIFLLGGASFTLSLYLVNVYPGDYFTFPFINDAFWGGAENATAAFYLLPARAWELMIGALVAVTAFPLRNKFCSEILSLSGLLLILYAVFGLDKNTPFPGIAATLPALGTVAIIIANTNLQTAVSKMLSVKPLVWLGLISYSLYLWHWPLLVFAKTLFFELNTVQTLSLVALSISLAWVTFTLVERPFIEKRYLPSKISILSIGAVSLITLIILGQQFLKTDEYRRVPTYTLSVTTAEESLGSRYMDCFRKRGYPGILKDGPCFIGTDKKLTTPEFVLWGDSHAGSVVSTVDEVAQKYDVQGVSFIEAGCIPLLAVEYVDPAEGCTKFNELALSYIEENNVRNVLIVANWNGYLGGRGDIGLIKGKEDQVFTIQNAKTIFITELHHVIDRLSQTDRNVYLLRQIPIHDDFDPRKLFYRSLQSGSILAHSSVTSSDYVDYNKFTDGIFADLQSFYGIKILDPQDLFCFSGTCVIAQDGQILYKDFDHVNYHGANLMTPLFETFVTDLTQNSTE